MLKNPIQDKTYFLKSNPNLFKVTFDNFSEKCFELTSLNEIIKQSNSNKGSFYYRFSDKKELYFALLDDLFTQQNMLFSSQCKHISSLKSIREMTLLIFQNSLKLQQVDARYLNLLRKVYDEDDDLIKEIKKNCVFSLHDRFLDYISKNAKTDPIGVLEGLPQLLNFFSSIYQNLPNILKEDFSEEGIKALVDQIFDGLGRRETKNPEKIALEIKNLSFSYTQPKPVLKNLSLEIVQGEILVVVGGPHSGKTTFQRLIGKVIESEKGKIDYLSDDLLGTQKFYQNSGFSFDKPCLFGRLTVKRNLEYFSHHYKNSANISDLLSQVGMTKYERVKVDNLTDFLKIKVNFLRAIINRPKLLMIDDILRGFLKEDKEQIYEMLLKCKASGSTIVMTTTQMSEALAIADRIAFLTDGKISSIERASNLKKKYDKKSLVVKYLEGGLENQQIFSMEEVKNHEFHSLLSDKAILSITTKNVLDNEIFKLETGVEL